MPMTPSRLGSRRCGIESIYWVQTLAFITQQAQKAIAPFDLAGLGTKKPLQLPRLLLELTCSRWDLCEAPCQGSTPPNLEP